jgi:hypothetical protein
LRIVTERTEYGVKRAEVDMVTCLRWCGGSGATCGSDEVMAGDAEGHCAVDVDLLVVDKDHFGAGYSGVPWPIRDISLRFSFSISAHEHPPEESGDGESGRAREVGPFESRAIRVPPRMQVGDDLRTHQDHATIR